MISKKKQDTAWRIIGTSVKGSKHLHMNTPCQDAFHYKVLKDGTMIISVSDGAGSADKAQEGSAFVSEHSVIFLEKYIHADKPFNQKTWKSVFQSAFKDTQNALANYVSGSESPLHDYSATLILISVTDEWTVCGMIGDCAAVAFKETGELHSLCKAQKGEYANMTNFITQKNAMEQLDIQTNQERIQGICVISDGLSPLALNISDNIPCPVFFHPLFNFAKIVTDEYESEAKTKLTAFLDSDRVNARTDDDKTLVIAVRT